MPKVFTVLALDGGGIRGLIPARVLGELERLAGRPLAACFDLVAAASTGALLGLLLTKPQPEPAARLADFYRQEGPKIFHRGLLRRVETLGGLLQERYDAGPLEQVLQARLGEARLKEALTDLLVPAYDLERREAFFFRSRRAREDARWDYALRAVGRAATAAPTYFEPAKVDWEGSDRDVLVDGGTFANNPGLCAYAEAIQLARSGAAAADEILLVSLGTGRYAQPIPYEEAKDWGLAGWARSILDVVFDGVSDTVDYQLRQLLPPREDGLPRYHRFQILLPAGLDALDDAGPEHLAGLDRAADELLAQSAEELGALAARLRELRG